VTTFYDQWMRFWDETTAEKKRARKYIHEEDVQWVRTPQDYKIGLLVAPETGFRTWGTSSMIAEIPPGWHTGKHQHGEEGMYITEGEGYSIVNGVKYGWSKGSCLWMPFGSVHQHFNTGRAPARYYSVMAIHLERFAGLAKLTQTGECGPTDVPVEAPVSANGLDDKGRRIVLTWDQMPKVGGAAVDLKVTGEAQAIQMGQMGRSHHSLWIDMMRPDLGFQNKEIQISGILSDSPGQHGGKHAHMEAVLYILQGEGYSIVDGEKVPWKRGTCFHVQGPQTVHQHFNESRTEPSHMLRSAPMLRMSFFQESATEEFPYLWWEPASDIPRTGGTPRGA
jgi:quercetin dioxygenase-like cupin family protein